MTNDEIWEIFKLPQPTWLVSAYDRKNKYLWKSYARALTASSACRAVRDNKNIKDKVHLSAHMVNAHDSHITWNDWVEYLKTTRFQAEIDKLNHYRDLTLKGKLNVAA